MAVACILLAGPAIAQQQDDSSAATVADLDKIEVTADRIQVNGGALGSRPALDTPFSITRIDADELAERQVNSLAQMFITDPSVSGNVGAYNSSWYTTIQVRGLAVSYTNGYKINGMPLYTYGAEWPSETMEQVQLLKGASAFMYGFGAPGGIVNYVTKKPTDDPLLDLNVGYRDGGIYRAHVDAGGRFGNEDMFGYRFNVLHEQGHSYNDTEVERTLLSLGVDARLSDALTWTADLLYQSRDLGNEAPVVIFNRYTDSVLPKRIDPRRDRSIDETYFNTEMQSALTGLQWQLNDNWNARFDLSYSKFRSAINKIWDYVLNQQGDTTSYIYDLGNRAENYLAQGLFEGRMHTGPVEHQIVAGASWSQADSGWAKVNLWQVLGSSNLYQDSSLSYHSSHDRDTYRSSRIVQTALFASDTLSFGEHWSVLLGLRHTRYIQDGWNTSGVQTSHYRQSVNTPSVAVMFKPGPSQTIYASYVESLEKGSVVGATYTNRNEVLPPLDSKQYELGYKIEQPRFTLNAALFRIERGAEYGVQNADDTQTYVQEGETRYQGVDVSVSVQASDNLQLGAGLTRLDAEFIDNTAALVGLEPAGAPEFQATLNGRYSFPAIPGLSVHAAAKHYGSQPYGSALYASSLYDLKLPSFTLLDAGASYRMRWGKTPLTLRAEITNLTDRRYWTNDGNGYGEPRTWSLSLQFAL
jgi:iron complex outermembrane receptor protein